MQDFFNMELLSVKNCDILFNKVARQHVNQTKHLVMDDLMYEHNIRQKGLIA